MAGEVEVERLLVRLVGDASNYQRMLSDAQVQSERSTKSIIKSFANLASKVTRSLRLAGTSVTKFGRKLQSLGRSVALKLTAPIVLGFGFAVKAFADFDKAMIESTSIMEVTASQTAKMRNLALELGTKGIQGPAELAKAYFFLASAGKNAEQSMALLPALLDFATAGAFDLALATDLLTDAQSALGLSSKDAQEDMRNMTRLSDLLVGANTLANATVQQFSTALTSKAGSAIKAYNIQLEDGIALLAAYADQGIKAELAGNAFDRVVRLLTKAYAENSKAFEKLNVGIFEEGEFRKFQDIIGDIERATQNMSTEVRAAALTTLGFNARVQGVILPLLGASQAIGEYNTKLGKMDGITKQVAEKQLKAFANQLKIVKNQILAVAIDIGEILSPMILKLTERVKEAVKWWKALTQPIKEVIVKIALLVATIGPALIAIGGLTIFLGAAVTALSALIGPAGLVIAAMAALAVGIGIVITKIVGPEGLKAAWVSAVKAGQEFAMNTLGFLANFRENINTLRIWLLGIWKTITENISKLFLAVVRNLIRNFKVGMAVLSTVFATFGGFLFTRLTVFFTTTLPNLIRKTFTVLIPAFVKLAMNLGRIFAESINPLRDPVKIRAFSDDIFRSFVQGTSAAVAGESLMDTLLGAAKDKFMAEGGFTGLFEGAGVEFPALELNFGGAAGRVAGENKFANTLKSVVSGILKSINIGQLFFERLREKIVEDAVKAAGDIEGPTLNIPVRFTTAKLVRFGSFESLRLLAELEIRQAQGELEIAIKPEGAGGKKEDGEQKTVTAIDQLKFVADKQLEVWTKFLATGEADFTL